VRALNAPAARAPRMSQQAHSVSFEDNYAWPIF
jgi:hypothetical protein